MLLLLILKLPHAYASLLLGGIGLALTVVALLLLTGSTVLGVMATVRWRSERWPRFVTSGLHRNVSLLALAFLVVHIVSAVADGFAPIGWLDSVIPFHGTYRSVWLGLGAVADQKVEGQPASGVDAQFSGSHTTSSGAHHH